MTEPLAFNPFDPAFRADPYPFYDVARSTDPVHRSPFGMVVLTRYVDVAMTLRGPHFSRDVEATARTTEGGLFGKRDLRSRPRSKSMLSLDPPDHTRLRSLVNKAFTPSAIERLRPRITHLVDGVLDVALERGRLELIEDLAFPVPFQVISDLLDMPTERADELRQWSQALTLALEPTCSPEQMADAERASAAMAEHVVAVIEERRRHLGDDVLSGLIVAEESGDRLTVDELVSTVILLYVAGHETTVNLIGNSVLALLRNPDALAVWRADPTVTVNAVDELLRFDGPVQLTVRVPMIDVTYAGGEVVEARTPVMVVLGAADHDPAVFADPHRLDLRRVNAKAHLAFAGGIHYCLGSSLARLEAQVALGRIIERCGDLQQVGEVLWRDRLTIRGVSQLAVAVAPA